MTEPGIGKNSNNPNDPQQADLPAYTANLKILVEQLIATEAKLIFATTTPYPEGVKPLRKPEYAAQYNSAALSIMTQNGIFVNDLYELVFPKLAEIQKPVNVHFLKEGSQMMAEQVARSIEEQLPKP